MMRILIVNNFHYFRGGDATYGLNLGRELKLAGYEVAHFSMRHPQNIPSEFDEYFVSNIDYPSLLSQKTLSAVLKVFSNVFSRKESSQKIRMLLDKFRPDIVHLNNFLHYLTLSIIEPIQERNIPSVWTLHDHILVCPNTNLFDDNSQRACDKCISMLHRIFLPAIKKCKKKSFPASLLAGIESGYIYLHDVEKIPYRFISPSKFLIDQHKKMGFYSNKFILIRNFVNTDLFSPNYTPGDYGLFWGNIVYGKGIEYAIEAFSKLKLKLVVVGDGPYRRTLEELAQKLGANVYFTGLLHGEQLRAKIRDARIVILPSVCFENAPLSIIEAYASGKPVVASDIGGIPELVKPGETGILFSPGNVESIIEAITSLWEKKSLISEMGRSARKYAEEEFSVQTHISQIISLYREALKKCVD